MQIEDIMATGTWTGEAAECEFIRQFARDFDWGADPIEDAAFAADVALSEIERAAEDDGIDLDEEAVCLLRSALESSAEKEAGRAKTKRRNS